MKNNIILAFFLTGTALYAMDDRIVEGASASSRRLPVVYHDGYDISFFGVEKIHPFDSTKYSKIYNELRQRLHLNVSDFYAPAEPINDDDLLNVHGKDYLDSLNSSATLAAITEVPPLGWVPNFILRNWLLTPMRYATAGTLLATDLAIQQGWAVNLSGGYHHAKTNQGGGFCVFGDIQLAAKKILDKHPEWKVLIVDLDAHQGNGYADGLLEEDRVAIFDMYGSPNYPRDKQMMDRINYNVPVKLHISDKEYLDILQEQLPAAIAEVKPNIIIYNAGSDIFATDLVGRMRVSKEGIMARDQFVFQQAKKVQAAIVMLLSGGYTQQSVTIVADSLEQIIKQKQEEALVMGEVH